MPNASAPLLLSDPGHAGIYVGGGDGALYKLNQADGTLAGRWLLTGSSVSGPTFDVLRNAFYVSSAGAVYSVDGRE